MNHRWTSIIAQAALIAGLGAMPAGAQDAVGAVDPVEARFNAVASHLDLGGDFYFYLNLEDLIEHALQAGRELLEPFAEVDQAAMVMEKLAAADTVLRESGIYNIASIGVSSKPAPDGVSRIKSFLGIDRFLDQGSLWKALGGEPSELAITVYAPEGVSLMRAVNVNPAAGWSWLRSVVQTAAGEEILAELDRKLDEGREATGVHVTDVINSLGDSLLVCGYLDPETTLKIPTGATQIEVPAPSILIALAVKDGTVSELLKARFIAMGMLLSTQLVDGVETLQVPNPFPLPVPLQPAMAQQNGVLLIASTPDLLRRALAAGAGTGRFVDSPAYARVFGGMPRAINGLAYVDASVSELITKLQMAAMQGDQGPPPAAREALRKWMEAFAHSEGAMVRVNLPDGILVEGVSNTSGREQIAVLMTVLPASVLAAIAVPAFNRAQTQAEGSVCINNLRMIDAAKKMWALEDNLQDGDMPSPDGLTSFFPDGLPVCPEGGAYTPGPIGTLPGCSVHGMLGE